MPHLQGWITRTGWVAGFVFAGTAFSGCGSGLKLGFDEGTLKAWGKNSGVVTSPASTGDSNSTPTTPAAGSAPSRYDGRGSGDGFDGAGSGKGKKGENPLPIYSPKKKGEKSSGKKDWDGIPYHSGSDQSQQVSDPHPHHPGSGSEDSWPSDPQEPQFPSHPDQSGSEGDGQAHRVPTHPVPGEPGSGYAYPYNDPYHYRERTAPASTRTAPSSARAVPVSTGEDESQAGDAPAELHQEPVSEPCSSHDPRLICLGIKYVSYANARGSEVESEIDAIRDIGEANRIWRECGIQFQIDEYQSVLPSEYELRYRTSSYTELNEIRRTFEAPAELLVVATGSWDRTGSLGNSGANAWTNLPGENVYGVVLEHAVTRYPQILAHELGHYLSLEHDDDPTALMSPIVHRNSVQLSHEECQSARWAARTYWRKMFR